MRTSTFEQAWAGTADLLYRVRQYDRRQRFGSELGELNEAHRMLGMMVQMAGGEHLADEAVEKLKRIRQRLLTMMEDLLYTAV